MIWRLAADYKPPFGEPVRICWDPRRLYPAQDIAKYEPGRGWMVRGKRMPEPKYWTQLDWPSEFAEQCTDGANGHAPSS